jgi:hypothetical protein
MTDNKYLIPTIVVTGMLLGLGLAYVLRAYPTSRLLIMLSIAAVIAFLIWRNEEWKR